MKQTKRTLAWLMSLALMLSLLPALALPAAAVDWTGDVHFTATPDAIDGDVAAANGITVTIDSGVTVTVNGTITVGDGDGTIMVEGPGTLVVNGAAGGAGANGNDGVQSGGHGGDGENGKDAIHGNLLVQSGTVTVNGGAGGAGGKGGHGNAVGGWGGAGGAGGTGVSGSVTVIYGVVTVNGGAGGTGGDGERSYEEDGYDGSGGPGGGGGAGIKGAVQIQSGSLDAKGGEGGPGGEGHLTDGNGGGGGDGIEGAVQIQGGKFNAAGGNGRAGSNGGSGSNGGGGGAGVRGDVTREANGDHKINGGAGGGTGGIYTATREGGRGGDGIVGKLTCTGTGFQVRAGKGGDGYDECGEGGTGVQGDITVTAGEAIAVFGGDGGDGGGGGRGGAGGVGKLTVNGSSIALTGGKGGAGYYYGFCGGGGVGFIGTVTCSGGAAVLTGGDGGHCDGDDITGGCGGDGAVAIVSVEGEAELTIMGGAGGKAGNRTSGANGDGGTGLVGTLTVSAGAVNIGGGAGGSVYDAQYADSIPGGIGGCGIIGAVTVDGGVVSLIGGAGGDGAGGGGDGGAGVKGFTTDVDHQLISQYGASYTDPETDGSDALIGGVTLTGGTLTIQGGAGGGKDDDGEGHLSGTGGSALIGYIGWENELPVTVSGGVLDLTGGAGGISATILLEYEAGMEGYCLGSTVAATVSDGSVAFRAGGESTSCLADGATIENGSADKALLSFNDDGAPTGVICAPGEALTYEDNEGLNGNTLRHGTPWEALKAQLAAAGSGDTVTLTENLEGPAGDGLAVPDGVKLEIPENMTLTVKNTITVGGGTGSFTVTGKGELTVTGADGEDGDYGLNPGQNGQDGGDAVLGNLCVDGPTVKLGGGSGGNGANGGGSGGGGGHGLNGSATLRSGTLETYGGFGGRGGDYDAAGGDGSDAVHGSVEVSGGVFKAVGGSGGVGASTKFATDGGGGGDGGDAVSGDVTFRGGALTLSAGEGGYGGSRNPGASQDVGAGEDGAGGKPLGNGSTLTNAAGRTLYAFDGDEVKRQYTDETLDGEKADEINGLKLCFGRIVTVTAGEGMTLKAGSGAATQDVAPGKAMTAAVYEAAEGYYFPENYAVAAVKGVSVKRDGDTQITVSGTPTADAAITLTAATAMGQVATPTFSPAAGEVAAGTTVTITCATDGATIRYTTDGSMPTDASPLCESAYTVNADVTIKAVAFRDGMKPSAVATAAYTIQQSGPVTTYHVTVVGGTGDGDYDEGETVTIIADDYGSDKRFKGWTSDDGVEFANAGAEVTTFKMPAKDVTVTANLENVYTVTVEHGTIAGGGSSGKFAAGESVTITAAAAPAGKVFDKWTSGDVLLGNGATSATASFTMPAKAVTVTATYKNDQSSSQGDWGDPQPAIAPVSEPVTTARTPTFKDVPADAWFYKYVTELAREGVIDGIGSGLFDPNGTTSWAMGLKLLLVAHGDLSDVTGKTWAQVTMAKAAELGLAAAGQDGDAAISRLDFCRAAAKLYGLTGTAAPFSDTADPSVLALKAAGVIDGYPDGSFGGEKPMTRAEISKVIYLLMALA